MDINTVTVREALENPAVRAALDSVDPKILKHPMLRFVKNKTLREVLDMLPAGAASNEVVQRVLEVVKKA